MNKIRISVVNYLNAKPFIAGLEQGDIKKRIHLQLDTPAICADKLSRGEVDIGLIPVTAISGLKKSNIISNYCIGASGAVKTVCLFSEMPLNEIKTIYLDYQSRTSVELVKYLCREAWHIQPKFVKAYPGFESEIKGTTAGVIIGDRTINFLGKYDHIFDLSAEWKKYTGLDFVFAAWVSNKNLPKDFIVAFNTALAYGLDQRPGIAGACQWMDNGHFSVEDYLFHHIQYEMDEAKRKGMDFFLSQVSPENKPQKIAVSL